MTKLVIKHIINYNEVLLLSLNSYGEFDASFKQKKNNRKKLT